MQAYLDKTKVLMRRLKKVAIEQIPRLENSHANDLASLASSLREWAPKTILIELLSQKSVDQSSLIETQVKEECLCQFDGPYQDVYSR